MNRKTLNELLGELDKPGTQLDCREICDALSVLDTTLLTENEKKYLRYDIMAFSFVENYNWERYKTNSWGTYFGPARIWPQNDNSVSMKPSLDEISIEVIEYWIQRMKEAINAVFKARYASLVWEFKRLTIANINRMETVAILIDSCIQIAKDHLQKVELDEVEKLQYALKVATDIGHEDFSTSIKKAIISYEIEYVKNDVAIDAWGILFTLFKSNIKPKLTCDEKKEIISRVKQRFERLLNREKASLIIVNAIHDAAIWLDANEITLETNDKSFIKKYINYVLKNCNSIHPIQHSIILQVAHSVAEKNKLPEEIEELSSKIRDMGFSVADSLERSQIQMNISKYDVEKMLDSLSENISIALGEISYAFLIKKSIMQEHFEEYVKNNPFTATANKITFNEKGILKNSLNSEESNLINYASRDLQLRQPFMQIFTDAFISQRNITIDHLTNHFKKSSLFNPDKKAQLHRGLAAYLNQDPITVINILIPQLEDAVRTLAILNGGEQLNQNRNAGFKEKTLGELLSYDVIKKILSDDVIFHLKVIYTENAGLNFRNNSCHGLLVDSDMTMMNANLVFHSLLILSLFGRTTTKSIFLAALTCPTMGWYKKEKTQQTKPTVSQKFLSSMGIKIGELARSLYSEGILIHEGSNDLNSIKTLVLSEGSQDLTLFEATFIYGGAIARADILHRINGGWHLIEVKSSLASDEVNDELIDDLTYTTMLMQFCGIVPDKISLMRISKNYRLGMDIHALFETTDCTEIVLKRLPDFIEAFGKLPAMDKFPTPSLIWACRNCEFFDTVCLGKDLENPIFDIPRILRKKFDEFNSEGYLEITDLPDNVKLTENQQKVTKAVKDNQPWVNATELRTRLNEIIFPAYYLDFETAACSIPLYEDVAPYQQLVTQYSIHQYSDLNTEKHYSMYLSDHTFDDRRTLAEHLLRDIGDVGSVIVYHAQAEKSYISGLANEFPDLATSLESIIDRIVDLKVILSEGYYHPKFHGSYSIKDVLPVLVPSLGYENLGIGDGLTASAVFAQLAMGQYNPSEVDIMRNHLTEYCKQDTLAMVKIHQVLEKIAG